MAPDKLSSPRRPWFAGRFGPPGRSLWGRLRLLIRFVRRRAVSRTVLCREGFYYLLVLVFVFTVAFLADMNLMMILAGIMAGPLWFSRRLVTATLRGLVMQRKMPYEICAGDMLVVTLELANTRRRLGSWAVVVEGASSGKAVWGGNGRSTPASCSLMCRRGRRGSERTADASTNGAAISWGP